MKEIINVNNLVKIFTVKKGPFFKRRKEIKKAVDGVCFSIKQGEIFSLLGPNGAGKTTTIKMLATLLIPSSGTATIKGFDVVKDDHAIRRILTAVLPGERTLFWKLTVRENLFYFGSLYGLKRSYVKDRYMDFLKLFNIEDKKDSLVEKLSTGERQKVVLSRALLPDPEVILLDEPTLGLDPVAAISLRKTIKTIAGEGKTILLTTHYMYEADELSNRVAIIDKGKIVCLDNPAKLKKSIPAKKIVRITSDSWSDNITNYIKNRFDTHGIDANKRNDDHLIRINCGKPDVSIAEMSEFLNGHGIKAHNISLDDPSLEDVYIEMTGKTLEEAE
jgi:ABC-2 type transport system ATP-binding protein